MVLAESQSLLYPVVFFHGKGELHLTGFHAVFGCCITGRVEVLAEVLVNGKRASICWAPPYAIDIQQLLHEGDNLIEIRVTNLWVNRLIGDEYLPEENVYNYQDIPNKYSTLRNGGIKKLPEWYLQGKPKPAGGRIAFTTWKHYDKTSPLVESGLLGPVTLTVGKIESLNI